MTTVTLTRLVVSVLVLTSFFVDGQTTDVVLTTAQLPPLVTAGDTAASLTSSTAALLASSTTTTSGISSSMSSSTTSSTISAATSTITVSSSAASSTTTSSSSSSASSSATPFTSTATRAAVSTAKAAAAASMDMAFPTNDPTYARTVAAVVGGCGLFILNTVFFIIVSLLLRYTVRMERHRMPKVPRKSLTGGGGIFYGGSEVQSNQALFAPSLSATNIVGGASDIQLDTRGGGRGVYHNRAFDSGINGSQMTIAADDGYKPIEIKSQGAGISKA